MDLQSEEHSSLWVKSRHVQRNAHVRKGSKADVSNLFDQFISAQYQSGRNGVTHCLGSLEIDRQRERTRLFDRQIGGLRAPQNPGCHSGALTEDINKAWTIPQQTTLISSLGPLVDRRQSQLCGTFNNDAAIEVQHRRRQNVERGSALLTRIIYGRNELIGVCSTNDQQFLSVRRPRRHFQSSDVLQRCDI